MTTTLSHETATALSQYAGDFGFLLDMKYRFQNNKPLSEKQVAAIEKCLKPKAPKATPSTPAPIANAKPFEFTAPAGSYAIMFAGEPVFVVVQRVTDETSKWFGWCFVKRQASDELYRLAQVDPKGVLKTFDNNAEKYLRLLNIDPKAASMAYGRLIGACGCCGKTLTNPESLALGIGPVCAQNNGW